MVQGRTSGPDVQLLSQPLSSAVLPASYLPLRGNLSVPPNAPDLGGDRLATGGSIRPKGDDIWRQQEKMITARLGMERLSGRPQEDAECMA